MNKKICVITGANSGIGYESVKQLIQEDCHVIMVCRDSNRGQKAYDTLKKELPNSSLELCIVDMGEQKSIKEFSTHLHNKYNKLMLLSIMQLFLM